VLFKDTSRENMGSWPVVEERRDILDIGAFATLTLLLTILSTDTFHLEKKVRAELTKKDGRWSTFAARQVVHARAPRTMGGLEGALCEG
jgi:hypothetical protein